MTENKLTDFIEAVKTGESRVDNVEETLSSLKKSDSLSVQCISQLGSLIEEILKKIGATKSQKNGYTEWLRTCYEIGSEVLEKTCSQSGNKEQRVVAFKALLNLLPLYNGALNDKSMFPHEQYGSIIRTLMTSEADISPLLPHLKELMHYQDMKVNIWKAVDTAMQMDRLPVVKEVRNLLLILGMADTSKQVQIEGFQEPLEYYSGTNAGVQSAKKLNKTIQQVWDKLKLVKVDKDVKQLLLLMLLEKMMPMMKEPVFLTDYFMGSLQEGGAIAVLSLQGIFDLILKYNINYPDVYGKVYSMFTPELFQTPYKSRFYHLSNMFLCSTMLPEALVAGFAKRLARLALVAPAGDALVLMDFIKILMVRHPNLRGMTSRPNGESFPCDPYLSDEPDPSESHALESSLWEIGILQNHVNPTVSTKASALLNKDDRGEWELSYHFDTNYQSLFEKSIENKVEEPPITFERPSTTFLNKPAVKLAFSAWE